MSRSTFPQTDEVTMSSVSRPLTVTVGGMFPDARQA